MKRHWVGLMFRMTTLLLLPLFAISAFAADARVRNEISPQVYNQAIIVFPTQLSFWNSSEGESLQQSIHLRQGDEHRFAIKELKVSGDFLRAESESLAQLAKKAHTVVVSLAENSPTGPISEVLTIITDHPSQPVLKLPIYGNVLDGIEIDPQVFGIKLNYYKRKGVGMIKITSTENIPFEVKGISSSYPPLKAALVAGEECCSHIIGVAISDPERKVSKPTRATLHVETTSSQGLIVIPVLIDVPSL